MFACAPAYDNRFLFKSSAVNHQCAHHTNSSSYDFFVKICSTFGISSFALWWISIHKKRKKQHFLYFLSITQRTKMISWDANEIFADSSSWRARNPNNGFPLTSVTTYFFVLFPMRVIVFWTVLSDKVLIFQFFGPTQSVTGSEHSAWQKSHQTCGLFSVWQLLGRLQNMSLSIFISVHRKDPVLSRRWRF